MSLPYDALGDLAVGARLIRQNTMQALQPLPNGYQLHLAVEDENWLGATLPLGLSQASRQATSCLEKLLHTQHVLPGGVKFGAAPDHTALAVYGDLPIQPRALLPQRWQTLQHGVAHGVQTFTRLCQGTVLPQSQAQESLPSPTVSNAPSSLDGSSMGCGLSAPWVRIPWSA